MYCVSFPGSNTAVAKVSLRLYKMGYSLLKGYGLCYGPLGIRRYILRCASAESIQHIGSLSNPARKLKDVSTFSLSVEDASYLIKTQQLIIIEEQDHQDQAPISDPIAATAVREIFELFANGEGVTAIVRYSNECGPPIPTQYACFNGFTGTLTLVIVSCFLQIVKINPFNKIMDSIDKFVVKCGRQIIEKWGTLRQQCSFMKQA